MQKHTLPLRRLTVTFLTAKLLVLTSVFIFFAGGVEPGLARDNTQIANLISAPGPEIQIRAADYNALTVVPAPFDAEPVVPQAPDAATFIVVYSGTWPAAAMTAFNYAVNIWSNLITSTVPISVSAEWTPLGAGVLGSAGAANYWSISSGSLFPLQNVFYPDALADRLAGYDIGPIVGTTGTEINASFNSTFPSWYFGTDMATPIGQYDFVSVVLHEIGHGLGFAGSATVSGPVGSWGIGPSNLPIVYDCFTADGPASSANNIINTGVYPNPSVALGNVLTGEYVYFGGANASSANGGPNAMLYAPSPWDQGSSYSHLDETNYPAGNPNSLMTPFLAAAEPVHSPGPITLAMFDDIGWDGVGSGSICPSAPTAITLNDLAASSQDQNHVAVSLSLLAMGMLLGAWGILLLIKHKKRSRV